MVKLDNVSKALVRENKKVLTRLRNLAVMIQNRTTLGLERLELEGCVHVMKTDAI